MFGSAGSIIVLPDSTWADRNTMVCELTQGLPEMKVVDLGGSSDAQRICAALVTCSAPDPLTFVSRGRTCTSLPAVALSMRSQRRRVRSYVLIDPSLPAPSEGWPDSPVSVVYTQSEQVSPGVRLSGWDWVVAPDSTGEVLRILLEAR